MSAADTAVASNIAVRLVELEANAALFASSGRSDVGVAGSRFNTAQGPVIVLFSRGL